MGSVESSRRGDIGAIPGYIWFREINPMLEHQTERNAEGSMKI